MEIYGRIIPRWRCSYLKQKYMYSTKIPCIQSMSRLSFNSFRLFSFHFGFFFTLYVFVCKRFANWFLQHYNIIFILASFSFEKNFISLYPCKAGGYYKFVLYTCVWSVILEKLKMRNVYSRLTIWLNWSLTGKISAHSDLCERIKGSFF